MDDEVDFKDVSEEKALEILKVSTRLSCRFELLRPPPPARPPSPGRCMRMHACMPAAGASAAPLGAPRASCRELRSEQWGRTRASRVEAHCTPTATRPQLASAASAATAAHRSRLTPARPLSLPAPPAHDCSPRASHSTPPPAAARTPIPACAQASHKGLSSEEAAKRLEQYGPNKLPEESRNPVLVYLGVSPDSQIAGAQWGTPLRLAVGATRDVCPPSPRSLAHQLSPLPLPPAVHVEPALLGHGGGRHPGHRAARLR